VIGVVAAVVIAVGAAFVLNAFQEPSSAAYATGGARVPADDRT
jgi:hypothetical protein